MSKLDNLYRDCFQNGNANFHTANNNASNQVVPVNNYAFSYPNKDVANS